MRAHTQQSASYMSSSEDIFGSKCEDIFGHRPDIYSLLIY